MSMLKNKNQIMKRFISLVVLCTCMFDAGAGGTALSEIHVNSENVIHTISLWFC